jgi:putative endonuclease
MSYRAYILANPQGTHYIGISENVQERIRHHNAGRSRWTKSRGPWELLWQSIPMSHSEARRKKLKRQKGGAGLQTLMADYRNMTMQD